MKKIELIINESHLYPDKSQTLIKDIIWAILWIGGILSLKDADIENRVLSSAYFIFSLSLLMEFFSTIITKKVYVLSKVIHALFCLDIIGMLLISISILICGLNDANLNTIMFVLSIIVMVFLFIDFLVFCFYEPSFEFTENDDNIDETYSEEEKKKIELLKKNSQNGVLGNSKGVSANE